MSRNAAGSGLNVYATRSGFWLAARRSLLVAALLAPSGAFADGPGSYQPVERPSGPQAASFQDEMRAIDEYNAGYGAIQRADHQDTLAAAAASAEERAGAEQSAREAYAASLPHFTEAVRLDPSMHEAYTYLGYANRKLGRHEDALAAYEQALRINPDYSHAIEYQGQAFLGLGRIDEAKFNYLRLYALNQAQAHKLLRAMRAWADGRAAKPPAHVDLPAFKAWIEERERSHDPNEVSSAW